MENTLNRKTKLIATVILLVVLFLLLALANRFLDKYVVRIMNMCAINMILALSLNLTNGFTGLFSLGTAGFMSIGAYATALLSMPLAVKQMNFFMTSMNPVLEKLSMPFLPALLIGGLCAALIGFLVGAPVLRLKGDYLGIATLGFGEIVAVIFTNLQDLTNGSLGLKGIPEATNLYWNFGIAAVFVILMALFISSSYGRALKAIREDEIAAQSMGINIFSHKMLSFTIGAFIAGVGGGLLASIISTIDPTMFRFTYTFQILLMVVLGGMKSITGTVLGATLVTVLMELLRSVESTMTFGPITIPGIPGMRMVVVSVLLIVVVIFLREGIMGEKEVNWKLLKPFLKSRPGPGKEAQ